MASRALLVPLVGATLLAAGCRSSSDASASGPGAEAPGTADGASAPVKAEPVVAQSGMPDEPAASSAPQPTADAESLVFASDRTATLWVKGLSCPYCVQNIDRQLAGMKGIDRVDVDLPTGRVRVELSAVRPSTRQQLIEAINDSGFTLDSVEMPR